MIENILYIVLIALGFPLGMYLSKICYDEIKKWKKRMIFISAICLIGAAIIRFTSFEYKTPFSVALVFITITFLTVFWRSR